MKTKLLRQKTAPIIGGNINNIDKLTCKQLLNFKLKNKKKLSTPLLLSPRPSKKVSRIAGKRLGDPQSSSEMRSLAGFVLRSKQQSLVDRKSHLRSIYEPIYFLGGMKP